MMLVVLQSFEIFFVSQDLLKLTLLRVPHPLKALGTRCVSAVYKKCLILANATSHPLFITDGNLSLPPSV